MNEAQTYCGLEMTIMQIKPSNSWIHHVRREALVMLSPHETKGSGIAAPSFRGSDAP